MRVALLVIECFAMVVAVDALRVVLLLMFCGLCRFIVYLLLCGCWVCLWL